MCLCSCRLACIDTSSLRNRANVLMHGRGLSILWAYPNHLWAWFPACPLFGGNFVSKSHVGSSSFVRCPESRSIRFSEVNCFSITTMLISIRSTELVRCREVVGRFSEGPLSEARLYIVHFCPRLLIITVSRASAHHRVSAQHARVVIFVG